MSMHVGFNVFLCLLVFLLFLFLYIFWLNIAWKMLKKENLELQCMTATQTRIKNVQQNDFCKKMFFISLFLALLYVFFCLCFFSFNFVYYFVLFFRFLIFFSLFVCLLSPAHVRLLLKKMDEQLFNHFKANGMEDLLFVHRYM